MNLGFIPEFSIQFRMYFYPQNLECEIYKPFKPFNTYIVAARR